MRIFKFYLLKFTRLRGDPYTLARDAAFGLFVGVLPLIPIQTATMIPLTIALRINTWVALLAAAIVSNPLTFALQYYYCWKIGNALLPGRLRWEKVQSLMDAINNGSFIEGVKTLLNIGFDTISVMLLGGVVLAIPIAIAGYFIFLYIFVTIHKKRIAKKKLN